MEFPKSAFPKWVARATCFLLGCLLAACSKPADPKPSGPATRVSASAAKPALVLDLPIAAGTNSVGQAIVSKSYPFQHGTLHLAFPAAWVDTARHVAVGKDSLEAVLFAPPNGGTQFGILVEIVNPGVNGAKSFALKTALTQIGRRELTNAAEAYLDIRDLKGADSTGAWFSITDKTITNVPPLLGEYKYLTEGFARTGGVILKFRLVSNAAYGDEKDALLEMIQTARFESR